MSIFALYWFCKVFIRDPKTAKPKAIRHYFNTAAPAGHVPDESEIPYWEVRLPEHY